MSNASSRISKLVEVSLLQDLAALAGASPDVPEWLEIGEQCRATAQRGMTLSGELS